MNHDGQNISFMLDTIVFSLLSMIESIVAFIFHLLKNMLRILGNTLNFIMIIIACCIQLSLLLTGRFFLGRGYEISE